MSNTKKFIVHEDNLLYTSHGPIIMKELYSIYIANKLDKNIVVAGLERQGEIRSKILSIEKIDAAVGISLRVSGVGLKPRDIIVYPNQFYSIYDTSFNPIKLEEVKVNDKLLTANGYLNVDYIHINDEENIYTYYILELEEHMTSLLVDSIALVKNPEAPKKKRGRKKNKDEVDFFQSH